MTAPIWNAELEGSVLGSALSGPTQAKLVAERCVAADFYRDANRLVLAEVQRMVAAGQRPDSVLVALAVHKDDRPHVRSLRSYPAVVVNAPLYIERLKVIAARRRLQLALGIAQHRLVEEEQPLEQELVAELVAAASDPDVGQEVPLP